MMFSMEKCSGHSCAGTSEESDLFTGGEEVMGKEGVPTDEVASAVASVSEEIGDILKDELGDADRAERIGAELADLSAELGILAGLADGETQQHFPALFEIAMQHHSDSGSASGSGSSGSSSSSWSYGQRGRQRRPLRPQRAPRRSIAKGKELSRRRVGCAGRALRVRRPPSDASDVGADSDSDAHWTDINTGSSDSSSSKEASAAEVECNGYDNKPLQPPCEPRGMGQLLLPLLCTEPADHRELFIRHDHIVKSLISAEEAARAELRLEEVLSSGHQSDGDVNDLETAPVTPEEEAALLQYVCEAEPTSPVPISESDSDRAVSLCVCGSVNCACVACGAAYSTRGAPHMLRNTLRALAALSNTYQVAVCLMRTLGLHKGNTEDSLARSNVAKLKKLHFSDEAASVIHEQLLRVAPMGLTRICDCVPNNKPLDQAHAVERFINILENYKKVSINHSLQILLKENERKKNNAVAEVDSKTVARNDNASAVLPWSSMKHHCDCQTPNAWCAQKWQQMVSRSSYDQNSAANNTAPDSDKNSETPLESKRELQQGDGTGAKPPDSGEGNSGDSKNDEYTDLSDSNGGLDDLSSSSSLSGCSLSSGRESNRGLWRGVAHLMKCIASVERVMDRVVSHSGTCHTSDRKRVDMGLTEVDRKLMAMYRRLPEVHRRQLQVYRKQKKLSTVCMQVAGSNSMPPAPPAPGSPPPAPAHAHHVCRAIALHYHLQRFKEVRRKVMHMRDQQLYYHRLRMWLEDQLKQDSTIENLSAIEDRPRRKKSSSSQQSSSNEQKSASPPLSKPLKILQLLRQKAPINFVEDFKNEGYKDTDDEVDPPEAFPLEKDSNISDSDTIVGEKETQEFCKEMKECLVKFANFALDTADEDLLREYEMQADPDVDTEEVKYPEAVSPPLQEMSPTTPEPMPVYTPKPSQRLLTASKMLNLNNLDFKDDKIDFNLPPDLNIPLNARRTPVLVNDTETVNAETVTKYLEYGLELKKAKEGCQNFELDPLYKDLMDKDLLDMSTAVEFLDKIESDNPMDIKAAMNMIGGILDTLHENVANKPDLMNRIMKRSFDMPSNVAIPDSVKLSDEAMRQIREIKLNKSRNTVKVTKNTAKRKINRRFKSSVDNDLGTVTFEIDCKEVPEATDKEEPVKEPVKTTPNCQDKEETNEACVSDIKTFDDLVKNTLSLQEMKDMFKSTVRKDVNSKVPLALIDDEQEELFETIIIKDLAENDDAEVTEKILERIEDYKRKYDDNYESDEGCEASKESLKQITKMIISSVDDTFDLLIMKLSIMSQDNLDLLKSLKFKYVDVLKRCSESKQLIAWIVQDPDVAANVIHELANLPPKNDNVPELTSTIVEKKKEYFLERLKIMNKVYMESLPKKSISGKEWLILLYKLEKIKEKIAEQFQKLTTSPKPTSSTQNASEAEILAAKGLSKIIGKATAKPAKPTPEPAKTENEVKPEPSEEEDEEWKLKTDPVLSRSEAIIKSKGDKSLMDSFYAIKSYIVQGRPIPQHFREDIVSICTSIDSRLIDEDVHEALNNCINQEMPNIANIEWREKLSAQGLKKAKQMLKVTDNRKNESDSCDTPQSDCKWTEDCVCNSCKNDIAAASYKRGFMSTLKVFDELREKEKLQPPAKPSCERDAHQQQHVCKVGHQNNSGCAGESSPDQPCTCCYCTVFGHAPPVTTPVPRNFNETRERLRSILNKKKQKCKSEEQDGQQSTNEAPPVANRPKPQLMPPALPKCNPPTFSPLQAYQKRVAMERQQKILADKMAALTVTDNKTEVEPAAAAPAPVKQKSPPVPTLMPEPLTIKPPTQQPPPKPQTQPQPKPVPTTQTQTKPAATQQKPVATQQKPVATQQNPSKPEPIYDIPIHNRNVTEQQTQTKPTLTQQQTQHVRQLQQLQLQQQQQSQQQSQLRGRQKERAVSVSSRDTSVFSTSSDSSADYYWRGNRTEDPRDLDALLQYIEGPARHVDRAKKRAKKQRQKAKKVESRLEAERMQLSAELSQAQAMLEAHKLALNHAKKRLADINAARPKKKGKKQKLNATQQAKVQQFNDQINELTVLVNATSKDVNEAEKQVLHLTRSFKSCVTRLNEARSLAEPDGPPVQQKPDPAALQKQQLAQKQQLQLQVQQQQQLQQQQLQHQQQLQMLQLERQKQAAMLSAMSAGGGVVRVRRCSGAPPELTLCVDPASNIPPPTQVQAQHTQTQTQSDKQTDKKQSWEQALAHINQLAKSAKDKKKKEKEQQAKTKKAKEEAAKSAEQEEPQLSKKQRKKLLAKQQAEEEEKLRQQELERSSKKANKKADKKEAKQDLANKKIDAHVEKKNEKKEVKKVEKEKKKESKQEKQAQVQQTKSKAPAPAPLTKKEKKKLSATVNNTNDTVIDKSILRNDSPLSATPGNCSIMQQLSSGVQVADLKLPPGITLTRLAPHEASHVAPPVINSVPVWKCNQLAATPTPVARPPPVIHAAPSPVPIPEQKTIIIPEPAPQPSKSKKSKKKNKKSSSEEPVKQQEAAKMVTLRNPMFHPNMPQVQVRSQVPEQIRIPEPIPMPPGGCQATITPTSNGMYTIRNPLMTMMHQQNITRPPYQQYYEQPNQNINLASFTQNNIEGYSLFNSSHEQQRSFLSPKFGEPNVKPNVSPSPIGTRPNDRPRDCGDESLFANNVSRPEPIGPPIKQEEYTNLYTPFPQQDSNVFRNALFNDQPSSYHPSLDGNVANGDLMPYFQRLRVGSKLNSEVTIHHVTESKFYKQEPQVGGWPVERPADPYSVCPPVACENQEQDPFTRYQYLFQRRT